MSNAHLRSRITHRFKRSETQGATAINMIQYTVHTLISLFVHFLVITCITFQLCATTTYCHCSNTHAHTTLEAHNQEKLCQVYCPTDFHTNIRDVSKYNYISCNCSPKLTQVPPSRSSPKQLLLAAKIRASWLKIASKATPIGSKHRSRCWQHQGSTCTKQANFTSVCTHK